MFRHSDQHHTATSAGAWHSARLIEASGRSPQDALALCETTDAGLTDGAAAERLGRFGPNVIAAEREHGWPVRLWHALRNPLVVLLAFLAVVSASTGDHRAADVMVLMIVIGVTLRLVQETRGESAAAALRRMIHVTATVVRNGSPREVPLSEVVPGDVVRLAAGDMVPGDLRLLTAKDLFVNVAAVTGESLPVEKSAAAVTDPADSPARIPNICLMGTSVQTGTATAVVVDTGPATWFGSVARALVLEPPPTAFDIGVTRFTWLMIGFVAVMVPLVFLINGETKHDWREAFFFALAVAVGLTPEMLPMIVSVCLSRGAVAMSRKRVIVKRLNSIQNFGAMDVLCADKTGTLTMDSIILERYHDPEGVASTRVLDDAILVSHFQTGLRSAFDRATLEHVSERGELRLDDHRKVDEMPFDFSRKLMSVVLAEPGGGRRLVAKGAPEEVLARCTAFEADDKVLPIPAGFAGDVQEDCDALATQGFRVLAVAYRGVAEQDAYGRDDEHDLILRGYIAFLDPPKESAAPAIAMLGARGIAVKILTGDSPLVTRAICQRVGLPVDAILDGRDIAALDDAALGAAVERTTIFARLAPSDKERIITALRRRGHVVGFLGDGINDAAALRVADVGISVDTAVDVAKAAADIILLEKSLMILGDGVVEGRKVFANVLKYIRMGASSNFGNMFSVLGASALLPFMPMAPIQVLTNNLLYDISQLPIPGDNVDPEQVARPRPWRVGEIARYILAIGPISSIFDYTTFALMYFVFRATSPDHAALFQTGWFVESLLTQTLIIHVIRTNGLPFIRSRASWPLIATTVMVMAIGAWLPFSPLAGALGFVPLPGRYWPFLLATLICYVGLTQLVKMVLIRTRFI